MTKWNRVTFATDPATDSLVSELVIGRLYWLDVSPRVLCLVLLSNLVLAALVVLALVGLEWNSSFFFGNVFWRVHERKGRLGIGTKVGSVIGLARVLSCLVVHTFALGIAHFPICSPGGPTSLTFFAWQCKREVISVIGVLRRVQ